MAQATHDAGFHGPHFAPLFIRTDLVFNYTNYFESSYNDSYTFC